MSVTAATAEHRTTASQDSIRLSELTANRAAAVVSVTGDRELRRRLLEMGFCNGAQVELVRRAPLGDPIEFRLRGYLLSLRNEQARHVLVKPMFGQ